MKNAVFQVKSNINKTGQDGNRTRTPLRAGDFKSPTENSYLSAIEELKKNSETDFAKSLANILQNEPGLVHVIEAWTNLSDQMKTGILAMVKAVEHKKWDGLRFL